MHTNQNASCLIYLRPRLLLLLLLLLLRRLPVLLPPRAFLLLLRGFLLNLRSLAFRAPLTSLSHDPKTNETASIFTLLIPHFHLN